MKAIYEAVCNMIMPHGDSIKQGTKSHNVKGNMAYFKTERGFEITIAIDQIDKGYFK
jgi:hypothetical protein